jgi:hypothetical protein
MKYARRGRETDMKCEECMMYDPDDNYCRWFQQRIPDITYECTVEYDENYKERRTEK